MVVLYIMLMANMKGLDVLIIFIVHAVKKTLLLVMDFMKTSIGKFREAKSNTIKPKFYNIFVIFSQIYNNFVSIF